MNIDLPQVPTMNLVANSHQLMSFCLLLWSFREIVGIDPAFYT